MRRVTGALDDKCALDMVEAGIAELREVHSRRPRLMQEMDRAGLG